MINPKPLPERQPALITAAEAAELLGVKPATLYAYVSRGLLKAVGADGSRRSLFERHAVDQLRARGRRARASESEVVVVDSALTLIENGRYWYRGLDPLRLAHDCSFEAVAELLWTGAVVDDPPGWSPDQVLVNAAAQAQSGLRAASLPIERIMVAATAIAVADDVGLAADRDAVQHSARRLIAAVVRSLPPGPHVGAEAVDEAVDKAADRAVDTAVDNAVDRAVATAVAAAFVDIDQRSGAASIAASLWDRLACRPSRAADVEALNGALVLLADHELAASTFAARIAASYRASPYAVVLAGLAVLTGSFHGGASLAVEDLIAEAVANGDARGVALTWLRRGDHLPGFGQGLYPQGDPRFGALYDFVIAAEPVDEVREAVDAFVDLAQTRGLPPPNVDFGLGFMAHALGLRRGSGEAMFAVARMAGWIAHALEEYEHRSLLRPRARYVGPPPSS